MNDLTHLDLLDATPISPSAGRAVIGSVIGSLFDDPRCVTREQISHYHSGVNTHGLIRGYADAGQPFCLPVNDMGTGIPELARRVTDRCQVLLDSGAFGAFTSAVRALDPDGIPRFEDAAWRAAALPLATLDFDQVAEAYRFIAADHPEHVTLVLPDVVGFQADSLLLLSRYREAFAWTCASQVTALLPIQRGAMSPAAYHRAAVKALGYEPDGWGFPSREAAMSIDEIVVGVRDALALGIHRVHFLGAGRESRRFGEILQAINAIPGVERLILSTDANTTRAYVGQGRPQTERRYEVLDHFPEFFANQSLDLSIDDWVVIHWSAFLDGELPSFLKDFHRGLKTEGLAPKARASKYTQDLSDYMVDLLNPETGEVDERIDALARKLLTAQWRAQFDAFATAAAAFDMFDGYPQPAWIQPTRSQGNSLLHLVCGTPKRRAKACA